MEWLHFCKFLRLNKCWIATAMAIHWTVHEASSARKSLNHSGFFSVWIWTIPHHLLTELALAEHRKINSIFIHYASHPKGSKMARNFANPKGDKNNNKKKLHNIHIPHRSTTSTASWVLVSYRPWDLADSEMQRFSPPNRLVDSLCFRPYLCSLAPPLFSQKEGFNCTKKNTKSQSHVSHAKNPLTFHWILVV